MQGNLRAAGGLDIVPLRWVSTLIVVALLQVPAQRLAMTGGGDVVVSREADLLRVSITNARRGLAHLCVAEDSKVRILHASAALGEAVYERHGAGWRLVSGFEFTLRDRRDTPPSPAERDAFLKATGWLANSDNSGKAPREFSLRLSPTIKSVAAVYLALDEPMSVSHWPATVADDCAATKMVQGFLAPQAQFSPGEWFSLQ
jgi:hypothetical protein